MKHVYCWYSALIVAVLSSVCGNAQEQWQDLNGPYENITLRDIYVKGDTLLAVGGDLTAFNPYILTSLDGGTTWDSTIAGSTQLLRSIDFADAQTGIITSVNSASCVLRTTDGGLSWTWQWCDTDSNFKGVNQVQFLDAQNGYMLGWGSTSFSTGSMYATTDAGASWRHVTGNLPDQPVEFAQWFDTQHGYTGSFLFGTLNLHRTSDGGQTWSTDLDGDSLGFSDAHFFDFTTGVLAGNVGSNTVIWHTIDSGASWQARTTLPNVFINSIAFENEDRGVAVGNTASFPINSRIYETEDGGITWTEVTEVGTDNSLTKVRYFEGRYYALSDAGDVFRSPWREPSSVVDLSRKEPIAIQVYPNPASDYLYIQIDESIRENLLFELFDATGRSVLLQTVTPGTHRLTIDRASIASGMYVFRLQQDQRMLYSGSLSIR